VVVAGASAGGVEALVALVRSLPADFPYPVIVVLHVAPTGTSVLPAILARACRLAVASPADGEQMRPGHVYVAPPDVHLVVEETHLRLSQAPRENGHRPAIDPTMRSAAAVYDGDTIGIVLSGSRDDGTAGLMAIKANGGTAIVQDPEEALYPAMPRSAMAHVEPDAVLRIAGMAAWILEHRPAPDGTNGEAPMSAKEPDDDPRLTAVPGTGDLPRSATGDGTRYTCPDCGGVLFEQQEAGLTRFRCSVGHVFSMESLAVEQARHLEGAMWTAVRALEDRAELLQQMARSSDRTERPRSARAFEAQAADLVRRAGLVRDAIEQARSSPSTEGTEVAS
jgi:two-component system, chemotaxis family, protein-glutamate methylesterase/glutaminase